MMLHKFENAKYFWGPFLIQRTNVFVRQVEDKADPSCLKQCIDLICRWGAEQIITEPVRNYNQNVNTHC